MDLSKTTQRASLGRPANAVEYERGGLAPWQVRLVDAHIETHLNTEITVPELASLVRLSISHFGRAFKATFGQPPHSHIVGERMVRAQSLMLRTEHSLAHIAIAVGMADQSHLSRQFRRFTGESPLAWRRARWTPEGVDLVMQ